MATRLAMFETRLLRPAAPKRATWSFLLVPEGVSARLPTRGLVSVDGTLNGQAFQASLEPDGQGSHWLKVPRSLREAAGAAVGDIVTVGIAPVEEEPEPRVPADLRKALADSPQAREPWRSLTPVARRDWIFWITSAKKPETRTRRVANTCDMLASGKRRVCCFDRSGVYSKGLSAPEAASE